MTKGQNVSVGWRRLLAAGWLPSPFDRLRTRPWSSPVEGEGIGNRRNLRSRGLVAGAEFDPLRAVHYHETDPGVVWTKDAAPAIDVNPLGPAKGVLTPNVVALAGGGYRMYYTGFAPGVTSDDHDGHILSASSPDGSAWTHDPGVRIDLHGPHATLRTLCPDVVPVPGGGFRMYYEARSPDAPTVILSATSENGLDWELEGRGQDRRRRVVLRNAALRLLPDRPRPAVPALLPPLLVPARVGPRRRQPHRERGLVRRPRLPDRAGRAGRAGDRAGDVRRLLSGRGPPRRRYVQDVLRRLGRGYRRRRLHRGLGRRRRVDEVAGAADRPRRPAWTAGWYRSRA